MIQIGRHNQPVDLCSGILQLRSHLIKMLKLINTLKNAKHK